MVSILLPTLESLPGPELRDWTKGEGLSHLGGSLQAMSRMKLQIFASHH